MYVFETACQTQLAAQPTGVALKEVNSQIVAGIKESLGMLPRSMGGGLAWPGLLR